MKKKKSAVQFAVVLVLCGLGGMAVSLLLQWNREAFFQLLEGMKTVFLDQILIINLACAVILNAAAYLFYRMSVKGFQLLQPEQEEQSEQVEKDLNLSMLFTSIGLTQQFLFFGISISQSIGEVKNLPLMLWSTALFLLCTTFYISFEVKCINLTKKLYPGRHTDPLSFKFDQKWEEESDERERFAMYQAAYRSFILLKYAFLVLWAILICLSLIIPIGILPFFLVAFLWALHTCSYTIYSSRTAQKKKAR